MLCKMRKILCMLMCGVLLPGLAACGDAGDVQTGAEQVSLLTGQVTYNADGTKVLEVIHSYNEAGRRISEVQVYADEPERLTEFSYDVAGRLCRTDYYDNGKQTGYVEQTYTDDGKPLAITEYRMDGGNDEPLLYSHMENAYDDNGFLVGNRLLSDDGTTIYYSEFVNDAQGNMTEGSHYFGNGEREWYEACTYNDDGSKNSYVYAAAGTVGSTTDYVYDETGNLLQELSTPDNGDAQSCIKYEYDTAGNMLSQKYYVGDMLQIWYNYTYDEQGRCLSSVIGQAGDYPERRVEYVYDEQGNMKQRKSYDIDGTVSLYADFEYMQIKLPQDFADAARSEQAEIPRY